MILEDSAAYFTHIHCIDVCINILSFSLFILMSLQIKDLMT